MTDQPVTPPYNDPQQPAHGRPVRAAPPRFVDEEAPRQSSAGAERGRRLWATLDKPLIFIVGMLLAIGSMMIYSTTFDWSFYEYGNPATIFMQDHMRNVVIGLAAMAFFTVVDYRFWRRFAVWLLLVAIGALVAVHLFGDDTFGARRALIAGRFQPGELGEFTIVFYMAAWLGSKNTKVRSITYGLIPFMVLTAIIGGLVALQPDLSSAGVIFVTAFVMFFLAGANIWHLAVPVSGLFVAGTFLISSLPYAQSRWLSFSVGLTDLTQTNYHTQQAITAFLNGGWFGMGLGQGQQKFGALPAPHTDSIFAIIGEELGVVGAAVVVLFFVAFAIRGFQIARRAVDPFGALLAVGFTVWVVVQALLNIAVMTAVVPSTGVPLPFISYGGSALLMLMIGMGLMLSVQRVAAARAHSPERRSAVANYDRGWGNRRSRLSGTGRRRSAEQARARRS